MNAFTDQSRDARLKLGIDGFCDTLRAPESLHRLVMEHKPAAVSTGDFALTALLNAVITRHMVALDYRAIQRLLDTEFGAAGTNGTEARKPLAKVPDGTVGAERHRRPA